MSTDSTNNTCVILVHSVREYEGTQLATGVLVSPIRVADFYIENVHSWCIWESAYEVTLSVYTQATDVRYSWAGERQVFIGGEPMEGPQKRALNSATNTTLFQIDGLRLPVAERFFISTQRYERANVYDVVVELFYKQLAETPDFQGSLARSRWHAEESDRRMPLGEGKSHANLWKERLAIASQIQPTAGMIFPVDVRTDSNTIHGALELFDDRNLTHVSAKFYCLDAVDLSPGTALTRELTWMTRDQRETAFEKVGVISSATRAG